MKNEVCQSYFSIDPRTKMLVLICAGITILGIVPIWVECLLVLFLQILLVNAQQFRTVWRTSFLFLFMLLLDIFCLPHLSGVFGVIVLFASRIFRIYLPIYLSFTLMIKSTSVSQCISALTKMHITPKIVIPLAVFFRFIPTIKEEWQSIHAAMKLKGIGLGVLNVLIKPMMTLEYVMVPLLISTSTIANELAAASLSRGLAVDSKRTCLEETRIRALDLLLMGISLGFVFVAKVVIEHD